MCLILSPQHPQVSLTSCSLLHILLCIRANLLPSHLSSCRLLFQRVSSGLKARPLLHSAASYATSRTCTDESFDRPGTVRKLLTRRCLITVRQTQAPQRSAQIEAWQGMLRVRRCLIPLCAIAPAELHEAGDVAFLVVSYPDGRHFFHSIKGGKRRSRCSIGLVKSLLVAYRWPHCKGIPSRY